MCHSVLVLNWCFFVYFSWGCQTRFENGTIKSNRLQNIEYRYRYFKQKLRKYGKSQIVINDNLLLTSPRVQTAWRVIEKLYRPIVQSIFTQSIDRCPFSRPCRINRSRGVVLSQLRHQVIRIPETVVQSILTTGWLVRCGDKRFGLVVTWK